MSTDFFPTFANASEADLPETKIDGVDILPLLRGEAQLDRDALFWHYPHYSNQGGFPGGALRVGHWKLIERFEDGRVHLFNLQDDIGEHNDLADSHPDRAASMRTRLHDWYTEVDAKFLQPKTPNGPQPWNPRD